MLSNRLVKGCSRTLIPSINNLCGILSWPSEFFSLIDCTAFKIFSLVIKFLSPVVNLLTPLYTCSLISIFALKFSIFCWKCSAKRSDNWSISTSTPPSNILTGISFELISFAILIAFHKDLEFPGIIPFLTLILLFKLKWYLISIFKFFTLFFRSSVGFCLSFVINLFPNEIFCIKWSLLILEQSAASVYQY